jgi:hypothetical protein
MPVKKGQAYLRTLTSSAVQRDSGGAKRRELRVSR